MYLCFINLEFVVGVCACTLSCVLTVWDPMCCNLPGSSVHGIFQARMLEQIALCFSKGSSQPRDQTRILHLLHWQAGSLQLSHQGSPNQAKELLEKMACGEGGC